MYLTYYVEHKDEVRERLARDLEITTPEVKELIQIVTFNSSVPSKKQLHFFKSFSKYKQCLGNRFIIGLSRDLSTIDKYLRNNLSDTDRNTIKDFKGKVTNIDIRVQTFQSIESNIMQTIQSMLSDESFHLHDAIYVKDVKAAESTRIQEYSEKNQIIINNTTLVFREYKILQEFIDPNKNTQIKSKEKLKEYIDFCLSNDLGHKIKGETELHHILPRSAFEGFENLRVNPWNGVHLSLYNHYLAHYLLTLCINNSSVSYAFSAMHNIGKKTSKTKLVSEEDYNNFKLSFLYTVSYVKETDLDFINDNYLHIQDIPKRYLHNLTEPKQGYISIYKISKTVTYLTGDNYRVLRDSKLLDVTKYKPVNKNTVCVTTDTGIKRISIYDERYLNGTVKNMNSGKVRVKNKEGEFKFVDNKNIPDGFDYCGKGMINVRDKTGNHLYVRTDDKRFLNGELQYILKGTKTYQRLDGSTYRSHEKENPEDIPVTEKLFYKDEYNVIMYMSRKKAQSSSKTYTRVYEGFIVLSMGGKDILHNIEEEIPEGASTTKKPWFILKDNKAKILFEGTRDALREYCKLNNISFRKLTDNRDKGPIEKLLGSRANNSMLGWTLSNINKRK